VRRRGSQDYRAQAGSRQRARPRVYPARARAFHLSEAQSSPELAAQLIERQDTDDTEPCVEKVVEHTHAEYWDKTLRAAEGRYLGACFCICLGKWDVGSLARNLGRAERSNRAPAPILSTVVAYAFYLFRVWKAQKASSLPWRCGSLALSQLDAASRVMFTNPNLNC